MFAGSRLAAAPLLVEARVTTPRDRRKKRHMSIRRKVIIEPYTGLAAAAQLASRSG